MLNCRRIIADADRLLAGELSLLERARIRMHLLICHHCRRYVRQLRILLLTLLRLRRNAGRDEIEKILRTVTTSR